MKKYVPRARQLACALSLLLTAAGSEPAVAATATVSECDVPIRADDGAVLRADIVRPAGPGRYPGVLTATVYGKDWEAPCGTALAHSSPFVDAGYAVITLDNRGTGHSEGVIDAWGPRDAQDYAEVLDWVQEQPWSDGKVATTGCSAPGQNAVLFAIADQRRVEAGKPRAVYATWADSAFADTLRDGWIGPGGATPWKGTLLAGVGVSNGAHAASFRPSDPAWDLGEWETSYHQSWMGRVYTDTETDGPAAFYGPEAESHDLEPSADSIRVPIVLTASFGDATTLASAQSRFFGLLTSSPKRVLVESPGPHCGTTEWAESGRRT